MATLAQWHAAQREEIAWWGNCTNTANEEGKQLEYAEAMGLGVYQDRSRPHLSYPFNLEGRSVLDIGGGPVSLLLKCYNRGKSVVIDPGQWPKWVMDRYDAAKILYLPLRAEHLDASETFDEVWLYNTLEHCVDPEAVIKTALEHGRVVRVFEWVGDFQDDKHPNALTKEDLDRWLGQEGRIVEFDWQRKWNPALKGYANVVYTNHRTKFRFHLLGLAHLPSSREFMPCAFTQKAIKLSAMLKALGHEVTFYGVEGSDVDCTEFVEVSSLELLQRVYGDYDWRTEYFKHDPRDEAHRTFNENAIREIKARQRDDHEFLLCTMGNYQQPIANALEQIKVVESGVGYRGIFANFKVFETYAWMHYMYGVRGQGDGAWYDCVIPNYFDPLDFPLETNPKGDYALYIGRLVGRKGLQVAVEVTKRMGMRLLVAGQGWLVNPAEGLDITEPHVTHLGTVDPLTRASLMGNAYVTFAPTYYVGPFEGVAVEAQMCGCPVLSTDWGAFTETIIHGVTGYRCRTLEQFLWAFKAAGSLSRADCSKWATDNFSMERVGRMYHEYFSMLRDLDGKGWYEERPGREELDWLTKVYPGDYHG